MAPYAVMFNFCDMVSGCNGIQLKSHMQWHSQIIKVFLTFEDPFFLASNQLHIFLLVLPQSASRLLSSDSVESRSLSHEEADRARDVNVYSFVRIDSFLTTQESLPISLYWCNLKLCAAFYSQADRQLCPQTHPQVDLETWYIWQLGWVAKSSKSIVFSCFFLPIHISLYGLPWTAVNPTLFILLTITQCCSRYLHAFLEILVLGEFLRGIFYALDCLYGP